MEAAARQQWCEQVKNGTAPMQRVVTLFETKQVNEERREIEGIATTPTVDRMGDVVVSGGAQFKLPISLLWQHQHDKPVGEVYAAKATDGGIVVKARVFKATVSEVLKARLDEAWESLKLGLVKGLSIGFAPLAAEPTKDMTGYRYLSWEWLELSLVTIPANVEATIATVKSFDSKLLAASGRSQRKVAYFNTSAGVSAPLIKEEAVNIPQQIQQLETTRGAKVARLNALTEKASAEGRTKDQSEKEEFDTLSEEIESIDSELVDQRRLEKINLSAAKIITPEQGITPTAAARERSPYITMERQLPKGTAFTRYVIALARTRNNLYEAMEFSKRWQDTTPEVTNVLKAAVAAGTTSDATWASQLVDYTNMADEFVDLLRPMTILGKFGTNGIPNLRRVPFNVRMTTQTTGGSYGWVGEGAPKPVTKLGIGEITLKWAKASGIIVVTDELMRFSSPSVEGIVRNDMLKGMALFSDQQFIDPDIAAVANVSPAAITYGATEINPTGTTAAALRLDLGTLFNLYWTAGLAPTSGVFIMSNRLATRLSLMRNALGQKEFPDMGIMGGMLEGFPVIASEAVDPHSGGDLLVFLNADDIFYADDGPVTIDASREASLQMDSAPTNPPTASTVFMSLWQMNLIALRAERYMNWQKRRTQAVAYIDNANYGE